ncbi:hypothetical protein ACFWP7_27545 [Streptomyces sp. NPDC058470]|uniref:hypothetical protein n=1 Tax=Streptomyces sp. NPDC058470 TaxID=3346515 RepID=UPI003656F133
MLTSRQWLALGNWTLLTGLALLGIGFSLDRNVLAGVIVLFSGLAALLICAVSLIFALVTAFVVRMSGAEELTLPVGYNPVGRVQTRWSESDELDSVFRLARELIPEGHPRRNAVEERLLRNSQLVRLVYLAHGGSYRLEGYIILYPLNRSAVSAVLAGEICAGLQIRPRHVQQRWTSASGIYIAAAAGSTWRARAAVVTLLEVMTENISPEWIFARPVTKDGLRLMRKSGFQPLFDTKNVWALRYRTGAR